MIHKTTRSILSVLLAALLLVTSTPLTPAFAGGGGVPLQSANNESRELTGSGTEDDPYQIATAAELREFAQRVNDGETDADAVLTADIDLSEICGENIGGQSVSWIPIGNSESTAYTGTFNGNGKTISGLYIDSIDNNQGLFGYVSGTVQNLSVSGEVSGDSYVGGVVGYNSGHVKNCYNTGSVSGNSVGGVVGDNSGTVKNCYNTGAVNSSGNSVGGVVGLNSGNVENCYNTGEVSGNSYVGGVVGDNSGNVENCYNTGTVSSNIIDLGGIGGVVGYNYSGGSVTSSYNTGEVSGSGLYVGGVVGYNEAGASVTGCYFLTGTAEKGIGNDSGDAAVVDNLSDLCDKFKDVPGWSLSENLGRPVLTSNHEGDGSKDHPYEIFTAAQLETFRDLVNGKDGQTADTDAHAKLMNNIDLNPDMKISEDGAVTGAHDQWTPIGTSEENAYTGTFNGNGKTIENLYINNTTSANDQGLFGYLGSSGKVQNLSVSGSVSVSGPGSGSICVGGVVGMNNGTVTNCYNTGNVSVTSSDISNVGGVVGYNDSSSTVENCYNTGNVSVKSSDISNVGGVVGDNGGTVINCYNTGEVSGPNSVISNVGGVVGYISSSSTVENCYNTGNVSVKSSDISNVGGVVGYNDSSTVENCYNTGKVSGPNSVISNVGGVVGDNGGTVINCYNTGEVSGPDSVNGETTVNVGGVVGYNAVPPLGGSSVTNCYNTGSVSDGTYTGGVVGWNDGANVTNCYFLKTADVNKNLSGIGFGGEGQEAIQKTADAFHSGEVAYLLQGTQTTPVWGQSALGTEDSLPTLVALDKDENAKPVYKVVFISDNTEIEAQYANSGMTVDLPATEPTKEGYTFNGWFTESSGGSQWNFSTAVTENMTLYAQWTAVEEPIPTPDPTPTPDPKPSGPSTGDSTGWDDIRDELENAEKGEQITIDMGDETKIPAEIFENLAGKDVEISFDLGDIQWSVNGADIPTDTDFTDLDLGVNLDTHGIPVNVINTITGEVGTVQMTLAHDGDFGFTMTLTAPLGAENAGYWANLYHYDEDAEQLTFETAAEIDADGNAALPLSHASQYAIVIDTHSHATVDVSDLFIDIAPDAWYKDAVQYAYDNGLMTGVSDTEFAPEATTTRAMIVSILARLENVTTAEAAGFADVDDNDWYATAVNWAASVGVVNGYEDNTFQPNTAITREQLAAILMNYAAYKGEDVSNRADLTSYTDQPSTWAEEAMSWAVAEGLISGVTNTELQPQGNATRAQVAAILQRYLEA